MSAREWKPGDVAMLDGFRGVAVVDDEGRFVYGVGEFNNAKPGSITAQAARPLVVIDPEDREQAERLVRAFVDALPDRDPCTVGRQRDAMAAALREFANPTPPKPEEPTGLGAVVEDRDGIRWVRSLRADVEFSTPWRDCNDDHFARHYDAVAAVRVLSEGVTQ